MITITKKTVSVVLGREDYIIALMNKMDFVEVERRITGGQMSEEKIQLTFEGRESKYNENGYIQVKAEREGFSYYYYLRVTDGYYTENLENFKRLHDKRNEVFIVQTFK